MVNFMCSSSTIFCGSIITEWRINTLGIRHHQCQHCGNSTPSMSMINYVVAVQGQVKPNVLDVQVRSIHSKLLHKVMKWRWTIRNWKCARYWDQYDYHMIKTLLTIDLTRNTIVWQLWRIVWRCSTVMQMSFWTVS